MDRMNAEVEIARAQAVKRIVMGELMGLDDEDDLAVVRDTIEGATAIHEIIELLVLQHQEDRALIEGLSEYIGKLTARKARLAERAEKCRHLLLRAMEAAELRRHTTPIATLWLQRTPPAVEVAEDAQIPEEFWRLQPVLRRDKLRDALKGGATFPGVQLVTRTTVQISGR